MLVSQKISEKLFSSYNYKDSYMQAIKYLGKFIKNDNFTFKFEKQQDGRSINLIIFLHLMKNSLLLIGA